MRSRLGPALSCGFGGRRLLSNRDWLERPIGFQTQCGRKRIVPGRERIASRCISAVSSSSRCQNRRTFEAENSLAGFGPFGKVLFHRASLALGNFPFQFGQQRHSSAARRETTLDLFVPGSPVAFAEPACQGRLLLWR